jgi:hypothetical protein
MELELTLVEMVKEAETAPSGTVTVAGTVT